VLLSEKVPVAVNCWEFPRAILGLVGVTAIETRNAGVTVRAVEPKMPPEVAVIVAVPTATGVALPLETAALLMAATEEADELQVTDAVISCVVLSEKVPVAVNCWVVPRAMLGMVGVTAMETRIAGVTVRVVEPEMPPDVAVTVDVPTATVVALPLVAAALLMVATDVTDELQVTKVVRSCVVLSEKVPVAVNCWVVPRAMVGLVRVTAIDTRNAGVIVRVVEPEMLPGMGCDTGNVAVIAVAPAATGDVLPFEPATLLIAATDEDDELQVTEAVRSCVVLSENVPVAVNCWVVPRAMLGLVGVTSIETRNAGVTVRAVEPVMPPDVAVTVAVPTATEVALPLEPVTLLMAATDIEDELQVTEVVRSCVVLSENIPVAVNCWVVPRAMLGLVGVTSMETRNAGVTVRAVEPEMPPEVAVIVAVPTATGVALPLETAASLIAATDVADELQVTEAVRSCVVLSENVPVAVNCWVVPRAMLGLVGVTAMETRVADVTDRVVEPETLPDAAVIVAVPAATAVAFPLEPAASLMATDAADVLQVTDVVRSWVVLSEKVPVAVNCWVVPRAMLGLVGVTAMETSVFSLPVLPPPPPQPAKKTAINATSSRYVYDLFFIVLIPLESCDVSHFSTKTLPITFVNSVF
jgi:hypothetical protein